MGAIGNGLKKSPDKSWDKNSASLYYVHGQNNKKTSMDLNFEEEIKRRIGDEEMPSAIVQSNSLNITDGTSIGRKFMDKPYLSEMIKK